MQRQMRTSKSLLRCLKYETDYEKRALLLRKGVRPYEYVNDWQQFDEARLPQKMLSIPY